MLLHSSSARSRTAPARWCFLVACAVAASPAVATAWQATAGPSVPRVPGFEIPPAPRDPDFPVLSGAVSPLEAVPHRPSPASDDPAPPLAAEHPASLPALDSWDRAVERDPVMRERSQFPADDDVAAWKVALSLAAVLGVAVAIVAAAGLRHRETDAPISVVRRALPGGKRS